MAMGQLTQFFNGNGATHSILSPDATIKITDH